MNKVMSLFVVLALFPGYVTAEPVLDEDTVKAISQELIKGVEGNDFSVIEKYMYPGSKIVVDMDPAEDSGQMEMSYDEYMALTKMGMGMMQSIDIDEEVISISVDEEKNQATIEEKTTSVMEMMGVKMKDVSVNTTTYGVVDGEIKVLSAEDHLISSEPVE